MNIKTIYLFLILVIFFKAPTLFGQSIATTEWQKVIPSPNLPSEINCKRSNNNLDIAFFKNKYYLAFRTAPTHFASKKTIIYIVSSIDLKNWTFEKEIKLGTDAREPRFCVYKDTLRFLFFESGSSLTKFEPHNIWNAETIGDGKWSALVDVNLPGFVPWRMRINNDTLLLSAYYGIDLYKSGHKGNLRIFKSTDAKNWTPISEKPQIDISGAEEGEFIFDSIGNLFATVRLESEGALICSAPKDNLQIWDFVKTRYKYDSGLLFLHGNDVYLVSRRNMDGEMDKANPKRKPAFRKKYNLIRYSFTKKKTALFKFNKEKKSLEWIMDFPSTGDNAFPGIVQIEPNKYVLFNYTNDPSKQEKTWIRGQFGKTYIYYTTLIFN
jgi:hypothetical protein